jgi:hypothetical protein
VPLSRQMRAFAFFYTRFARRWVPLVLSILIHIAVIVGLIYVVHDYHDQIEAFDQQRATVPDALLVEGEKVGVSNIGIASAPSGAPMRTLISPPVTATDGVSNIPSPPPSLIAPAIGSGTQPLIGLGAACTAAPAPVGIAGSPALPRAQFMGISGDAIRVAFVCDASGSMMDRLPILQAELKQSIDQLQPIQWFNVIYFQNGHALAADPHGLIQALPTNSARIKNLLQTVQARGSSNPLPAMELAFSQRPQVIYLLTDGDFEDVTESITDAHIIAEIRRLNPNNQVCVNTILFISDAADLQQDDARAGKAVLTRIAADNGGTFKVVVAEQP